MIIVDTNTVSELSRQEPNAGVAAWFDAQDNETLYLTAINVAEMRHGVLIMPEGKRKDYTRAFVNFIIADNFDTRVLPFDQEAAELQALLLVQLTQSGITIEQSDTMIAAIALAHGAQVATRNVKHFAPCGVEVINPFDL